MLHCHQTIEKILKAIIVELNPHYLPAKYPDITFKFNYDKTRVKEMLNIMIYSNCTILDDIISNSVQFEEKIYNYFLRASSRN